MTVGDFDDASPEIKEEVQKLRDMSVKVVVIGLGLPSRNKLNNVASGIDIVVTPKPGDEDKTAKEVPYRIARGIIKHFHMRRISYDCKPRVCKMCPKLEQAFCFLFCSP